MDITIFETFPRIKDLKPRTWNIFKAQNAVLFDRTESATTVMYKGRLWRDWVFVYHYPKKLENGVTYAIPIKK